MKGSIEWRGPNTARLVVSCGFDGNGKRILKKETVKVEGRTERARQKAAENALADFIARIDRDEVSNASSRLSFQQYIEDIWIPSVQSDLAPKTTSRYKELFENRVFPVLGGVKLIKLKPLHFIRLYEELKKAPRMDKKEGHLSGTTILQIHRVISSSLTWAVHNQYIVNNPASRVKPPKKDDYEAGFYDEEQLKELFTALKDEKLKWQVTAILAITLGARRGEIAGLEWTDIDLDTGDVNIVRTSQYIVGQGVITKRPKNDKARTVTLPGQVIPLLIKYKAEQAKQQLKCGDLWKGSNRLLTTWDGAPMHPDSISSWWDKFVVRKNLPIINFHGLRHTSATWMISKGHDVKTVSGRLGHSKTSVTLDIYSHQLKSKDKEVADGMNELFHDTGN